MKAKTKNNTKSLAQIIDEQFGKKEHRNVIANRGIKNSSPGFEINPGLMLFPIATLNSPKKYNSYSK